MSLFLLISISLYIIIMVVLLIKRSGIPIRDENPKDVSVIVAYHNEEHHLDALLHSFKTQNYDLSRIQFIFVNDRSTDHSESIVQKYESQLPDLEMIKISELPEGKFGKKNALNAGIQKSKYDILLFTDADCVCDPNWIKEMTSAFSEKTGCVVGQSILTPSRNRFIPLFQESESYFNHIVAERSVAFNYAVMSFGRNFAYRKSAFDQIGGFDHIDHSLSGDDDMILAEFNAHKIPIAYQLNSNAPSETVTTWHELIKQKKRHMSVTRFLPKRYQVFALLYHGTHFATYIALIYAFLMGFDHQIFLLKIAVDLIFFARMNQIIKYSNIIRVYMMWSLCYWIFVPIMTLVSYQLKPETLTWK